MKEELNKNGELLNTLRDGVREIKELIKKIGDRMLDSTNRLRIEESWEVFTDLTQRIDELKGLIEFVGELKNGLKHLKGYDPSTGHLSCWDGSTELFQEMLSAFERKDWILFADLVEYELQPLLIEGEKGFSELSRVLERMDIPF